MTLKLKITTWKIIMQECISPCLLCWKFVLMFEEHATEVYINNKHFFSDLPICKLSVVWLYPSFSRYIMFNVQFIRVLLCNFGVRGLFSVHFRAAGCLLCKLGVMPDCMLEIFHTDLFHCKLKALTTQRFCNFRDVEFIVCKEIAFTSFGAHNDDCCNGTKPEPALQPLGHNSIIHAHPQDSQGFLEVSGKPPGKVPKSLGILGQSLCRFCALYSGESWACPRHFQTCLQHLKMENRNPALCCSECHWTMIWTFNTWNVTCSQNAGIERVWTIRTGKMEQMMYVWSTYHPSPR